MDKVLCLLYHRVNIKKDNFYDLTVSPERFEQQIKFLKDNYKCLRFEDAWKDVETPSVVITFDDGYADNLTFALPILERYQMPATIFIATGNIDTQFEFWWDDLTRMFTQKETYPDKFTLDDELFRYTWETDTEEKRFELAKTIRWLLRMEPELCVREQWFKQIREWADVDTKGREECYSLSAEQLKVLADSAVITVGAHTVNHISLGAMNKEQQETEIVKSIQQLKEYTGRVPTVFSYPFGSKMDFNNDTIDICQRNGIIKAATTTQKIWNPNFNSFQIPRITIRDWEQDDFRKNLELIWSEE